MRLMKAFFEVRHIKVTPDALRMWLDALSDLTPAELVDAFRRFNREATDFPTPAAVRRYAGSVAASIEDRARVAWAVVRREISRTGAYDSIDFDDAITNATIRAMGGWDKLCDSTSEVLPFRERDFLSNYGAICRTGVGDGSALIGLVARHNGGKGFECPEARRIETGLTPHAMAKRLSSGDGLQRLSHAAELAKRLTVKEV
jgi:hypothetical protein